MSLGEFGEEDDPARNLPLLRKANEWVQAEALLPLPEREWEQSSWMITPSERKLYAVYVTKAEREAWIKCGTAYCIAGYVASLFGPVHRTPEGVVIAHDGSQVDQYAAVALGLTGYEADELFEGDNSASFIDGFIRNLFADQGERYDA
jgi:hypothetical protein